MFIGDPQHTTRATLDTLDRGLPRNPSVKIQPNGRIIVSPLVALPEPVHLSGLKDELVVRWPMTSLLDILKELICGLGSRATSPALRRMRSSTPRHSSGGSCSAEQSDYVAQPGVNVTDALITSKTNPPMRARGIRLCMTVTRSGAATLDTMPVDQLVRNRTFHTSGNSRPRQRLFRTGTAAEAAGLLIKALLGIEFVLAGLSKVMDSNLVVQFTSFVAAQPGSSSGPLAPIVHAVVSPHAALAVQLTALLELGAGGVLLLSALEPFRRRFTGEQHVYATFVALAASAAAVAVACLSLMIYLLQGGGLPTVNAAAAFESPIAIELFLVPVAVSAAWLEFCRFMTLRR